MKKSIIFISPDTLPLPIKDVAPETIIENNQTYSLKDKCSRVTGLGKRIWKLAEVLAKTDEFNITILVPNINYPGKEYIDETKLLFKIEPYNLKAALWDWSEELDRRIKDANFVIVQTATGIGFKNCSVLPNTVNVIADGFVPIFAELPCSLLGQSNISRKMSWDKFTDQYLNLLLRANCVLYANDRQYYYYEGQFFAINKLDWKAFKFSPLLKVPLGIDIIDKVARPKDKKLKLLWYGPVYPWYKPEKILDVAAHLNNTTIDFIGIKHPRYTSSYNKFFKKFFDANETSKNINIVEEFCDNLPKLYESYDAGIVLAREWLEEKYSSRGRILDMLSNGLPVLLNKGNSFFNELSYLQDSIYPITSRTLMKDLSEFELNKGVLAVSDRSFELLQKNLSWSVVAEPLVDYIRNFSA
jgi:hypothetical protein